MKFFELKSDGGICLGNEIMPSRFSFVSNGVGHTKESDIESLIIDNPSLLNCDDQNGENELLIVSQQVRTQTDKRCDLLAIDREGYLVTVEIKRDVQDEATRTEAFESQCIRYAASHMTLSVDDILREYAKFLEKNAPEEQKESDFEELALQNILKHLDGYYLQEFPDATDRISRENLEGLIVPSEYQKLYLVASDFDKDCLSACVWLRKHNIDIYCFRLQPYPFGGNWYLNQQRLLPPPSLEQYLVKKREEKVKERIVPKGTKQTSIRPVSFNWNGQSQECKTWSALFISCMQKALDSGLAPELLETKSVFDKQQAYDSFLAYGEIFYTNGEDQTTVYIDKHGSGDTLRKKITLTLDKMDPRPQVTVLLEDESTVEL